MKEYVLSRSTLTVDFANGCIASMTDGERELTAAKVPLFVLGLRNAAGDLRKVDAYAAASCIMEGDTAVYTGFPDAVTVRVRAAAADDTVTWFMAVENRTGDLLEWVDFPEVCLPALEKNGGTGSILYPFNEGVVVDDLALRESSHLGYEEPEYPSLGKYNVFPNMLFSQFMAYMYGGRGLYMAAHDPERGVKYYDFRPEGEGVLMKQRLYTGADYGADWECGYPLVWTFFDGGWETGADLYRTFLETALPPRAAKVTENPRLPDWYGDAPVVVTYPIRGIHDMDEMKPNSLYPYADALPRIDEIAARTGSRVLVLLMHWEGTAPWAPPYVWPPYGGEEEFLAFRDALHARGHLLGVYCSGFGYTLQSNLIDDYNKETECAERGLLAGMCVGPDGKVGISRICTAQRKGYDLCPASPVGREVLAEAYAPLFASGVDYAQILDQNHGGSQYFCYSREHGHPASPGAWMTGNMQDLLSSWNEAAPDMLFGCESAAAEPYIGNLLFSDNRYELNYFIGRPVPLYGFLYHDYLRNFMGNQVSSPLDPRVDTLPLRMAYSWTAGDSLTLILDPRGGFMDSWGTRDFEHLPDPEGAMAFAARLQKAGREEAAGFLTAGRMVEPLPFDCGAAAYPMLGGKTVELPDVFSTAWEYAGKTVQIFANHTVHDAVCRLADGREITVPARDVRVLERV